MTHDMARIPRINANCAPASHSMLELILAKALSWKMSTAQLHSLNHQSMRTSSVLSQKVDNDTVVEFFDHKHKLTLFGIPVRIDDNTPQQEIQLWAYDDYILYILEGLAIPAGFWEG